MQNQHAKDNYAPIFDTYPLKKTLITCHRNADFDALTSMIGISFLFPHATLLYPGSQEKEVQEFFDDFASVLFSITTSAKDIDFSEIERLVLVDTQNSERLQHIEPLFQEYPNILIQREQEKPTEIERFDAEQKAEYEIQSEENQGEKAQKREHQKEEDNLDYKVESIFLEKGIENTSPSLEVLVWDHHPTGDILAHGGKKLEVGSTCTLVCEELEKIFGEIPCELAHVLALGLYVDTGSFTYNSTRPEDYIAGAWLLRQGFKPDFVNTYTKRALTKEQLEILNELANTSRSLDISGLRFVIASAHIQEYCSDFSSLTPYIMDMMPCDVLFALASMEDKIHLVARSKSDNYNVAEICTKLGGGGHKYAASAIVKDMVLFDLLQHIETQISLTVHTDKTAQKLMNSPVVYAYPYDNIEKVEAIMSKFGLKALPILDAQTSVCVGWIEQQTALNAVSHKLGKRPVLQYMQQTFRVVSQDASLQMLMDIIVGERQRLIPVVREDYLLELEGESIKKEDIGRDSLEDERLKKCPVVGVITRTDLIRIFLDGQNIQLPKPRAKDYRKRNVEKILRMRMPKPCIKLLEIAGELGSENNVDTYVVGGFVRDLLLDAEKTRWPFMDVDLVVSRDALDFAHRLANKLGGRVREHKEFMTALVLFNASVLDSEIELGSEHDIELRVDVATARLEYYKSPGALPTVELSSIRMDLGRRDFAINAMAIQLNKENFGTLIDFFDGQGDIKQKRIRMLHALSFVEDPTRVLRAIRFEQRYGFKVSKHCDRFMRNSVELDLFTKVSGKRLLTELEIILRESQAFNCLLRLQDYGVLQAIDTNLDLQHQEHRDFVEECYKVYDWYKLLYLDESVDNFNFFVLALCRNASMSELKGLFERLELIESRINSFMHMRSGLIHAINNISVLAKENELSMSALHELLLYLPMEAVLFLLVRSESLVGEEYRKMISQYVYQWRYTKLDISGKDLIEIGVKEGPLLGEILRTTLKAKIDGNINGYEEEILFAEDCFMQLKKKDENNG